MEANVFELKAVADCQARHSEETIAQWLVDRVAAGAGVLPQEIDVSLPFSYFGLNSIAAISLSAELEDWLGRKLAPTLTWDYPSIELLASYLAQV